MPTATLSLYGNDAARTTLKHLKPVVIWSVAVFLLALLVRLALVLANYPQVGQRMRASFGVQSPRPSIPVPFMPMDRPSLLAPRRKSAAASRLSCSLIVRLALRGGFPARYNAEHF